MSTSCIVKIIDKETNKEVLLYHHYDGYVSENCGVAFDICNTFYNKRIKKLDLPLDFTALVNEFLKGEVGDNDTGYMYRNYIPSDIEYMYTITCRGTTTDIMVQEVNYTNDGFKISQTWCQPDLVKLYRNGIVEPIMDGQKAAVHIIWKRELNWSIQRYKDLLKSMFYVESCKELNTEQANILINTLNSLKEV